MSCDCESISVQLNAAECSFKWEGMLTSQPMGISQIGHEHLMAAVMVTANPTGEYATVLVGYIDVAAKYRNWSICSDLLMTALILICNLLKWVGMLASQPNGNWWIGCGFPMAAAILTGQSTRVGTVMLMQWNPENMTFKGLRESVEWVKGVRVNYPSKQSHVQLG